MLETLNNLKNNKIKTPGNAENMERLKKFVSGITKRQQGEETRPNSATWLI